MAKTQFPQLNDVAWLTEHYVDQQLSASAIAKLLGCQKHGVYRALERHEVPRRPHTSKFPQLNDKQWLHEQYVEKQLSTKQIADMIGSTVGNVGSHLRDAGIEARSYREGRRVRFDGQRLGPAAPNWRGGRRLLKTGYVMLYAPDHPRAGKSGAVFEHILVMEQVLHRYLEPNEIVHHINHVRDDNRPENLAVKKNGQHIREHFDAGKNMDAALARIEQLEQFIRKAALAPPD